MSGLEHNFSLELSPSLNAKVEIKVLRGARNLKACDVEKGDNTVQQIFISVESLSFQQTQGDFNLFGFTNVTTAASAVT